MKKMQTGLILCIVSIGLFLSLGTINPAGATKYTTTHTITIVTDYYLNEAMMWMGWRRTKLDIKTTYEHYYGEKFYFWNQKLRLYTTSGGVAPPPIVPINVWYNGYGGGEVLQWYAQGVTGWPLPTIHHDETDHIFIDWWGQTTDSIKFCADPDIDSPLGSEFRKFYVKCWNWRSGLIEFEYYLDA